MPLNNSEPVVIFMIIAAGSESPLGRLPPAFGGMTNHSKLSLPRKRESIILKVETNLEAHVFTEKGYILETTHINIVQIQKKATVRIWLLS